MKSEELEKLGFKMFVGLINPDEGLDASGFMMDDRFSSLFESYYGRQYIPAILDNEGEISAREEQKIKEMAREKAVKEARAKNMATDETIRGIKMRKALAHVPGEIVLAPIPEDFADKIRSGGPFKSAKLLLHMATHVLEGNRIRRIEQDEKEDMIDEIEMREEMIAKKAERRKRRENK